MAANGPRLRLTLADGIQVQGNGKLAVTGLYPDCVVVIQVPADRLGAPAAIQSLALLATVTDIPVRRTSLQVSAALVAPDGKLTTLGAPMALRHPGAGRSLNLLFNVAPITFTGPGQRALRIHLDELHFDLPYEVRLESAPPAIVGELPASPRKAPRKAVVAKKVARKKAGARK